MKILFDFRSYQISNKRGIGRYYLSLCEHMLKLGGFEAAFVVSKKHDLDLPQTITSGGKIYLLEELDKYNISEDFDFLFKGNFFDINNRQNFLDILYPQTLLKRCQKIVGIMHDHIPMVFSANYLYNKPDHNAYSFYNEALSLVNHLFANSVCTKEDCVKFAQIPEKDVTVIYGGADQEKFKTAHSNAPYIAAERGNYLIFTAGNDLRKNFHGAAKAFAIAYDSGKIPQDAKLYLVCKHSDWFIQEVEQAIQGFSAKIGEQIIITGFIEDAELVDLLGNAKASIFPSFYEGLGLPILESYAAGTPCFASNISATKEFVLPECSFNPYNEQETAEMIIQIFNNPALCEKSLTFGRQLLNQVNWENAAQIVIAKLQEIKATDERLKKVAVFTPLPPEKTGIAAYSYKTHINNQDKFDIISDIQTIQDYNMLLNHDEIYRFNGIDFSFAAPVKLEGTALIAQNIETTTPLIHTPPLHLQAGTYELVLDYALSDKTQASVQINGEKGTKHIGSCTLLETENQTTYPFTLTEDTEDIDFSISCTGKEFVLNNISICKKSNASYPKATNIIPYASYYLTHLSRNYIGKIFVLGNSKHHNISLQEAIRTNNLGGGGIEFYICTKHLYFSPFIQC